MLAYFFYLFNIDDIKKSSVSRMVLTYSILVLTCSRQHLHNTEKEKDLTKSTGIVPAKYPPKVKLENSSQL